MAVRSSIGGGVQGADRMRKRDERLLSTNDMATRLRRHYSRSASIRFRNAVM